MLRIAAPIPGVRALTPPSQRRRLVGCWGGVGDFALRRDIFTKQWVLESAHTFAKVLLPTTDMQYALVKDLETGLAML